MRCLLPAFFLAIVVSTASAEMSSDFVRVDNSAALSGYTTFDWVINTDTDWGQAELLITLDQGSIYQDSHGGDVPPHQADIVQWPTLEFDSYLTAGQNAYGSNPNILGGAVDFGGGASATIGTDRISALWYNMAEDDLGDVMLSRLTFSNDVQGQWHAKVWAEGNQSAIYEGMLSDLFLTGDLDQDSYVGPDDLTIVHQFWGQTVTPRDLASGDASGDGFVGGADLDLVRASWGSGTPPNPAVPTAVPEPSTLMLCASLAAMALGVYLRSK